MRLIASRDMPVLRRHRSIGGMRWYRPSAWLVLRGAIIRPRHAPASPSRFVRQHSAFGGRRGRASSESPEARAMILRKGDAAAMSIATFIAKPRNARQGSANIYGSFSHYRHCRVSMENGKQPLSKYTPRAGHLASKRITSLLNGGSPRRLKSNHGNRRSASIDAARSTDSSAFLVVGRA